MKRKHYYRFPIGWVRIEEDEDGYITRLCVEQEKQPQKYGAAMDMLDEETPLMLKAREQLMEYFSGWRKSFDLPIKPEGTDFQKRVWAELVKIPYGETRSYKQVAESMGSPRSSRAIGGASNKNPIMILIPCHRVVGADGSLTGFAAGVEVKKQLLDLEQRN